MHLFRRNETIPQARSSKIERELHYLPIHPLTVAVTLQPLIWDQGCSLPKVTRPNRPFRFGVTVVCSWKPAGLKDNYRSAGVKSPARSCSPHVLIAHRQVTIAVRENRTRWQPVSCQWKSIFKWKYMFSLAQGEMVSPCSQHSEKTIRWAVSCSNFLSGSIATSPQMPQMDHA